VDGLITSGPEARADRRPAWYDWRRGGTGGDIARTNGGPIAAILRSYLAVAVFLLVIDSINVLSQMDEAARSGHAQAAWIPIGKELSSAIGALLACGLIHLAMRIATPGRVGWLRVVLVHAPASIVFSAVHQTVMTRLRIIIFADHGQHYQRPPLPGDWLYEYRKDLIGYAIIAGLFWLFRAPGLREPEPGTEHRPDETPPALAEPTFDIVDGAKTLRIPVAQILAVRAVHNYVEFLLEDGRTPLMRASLSGVEAVLVPRGLVRTHRSWLINPRHLRSLEATGAGDYRLGLADYIQAPLSRRFPAALKQLRGGRA